MAFSQVQFGLKAGYLNSTRNWNKELDDALKLNNKSSIVLGGFSSFRASKVLALQIEMLYSQRGYATPKDGLSAGIKAYHHYLSLPLMVKLYPIQHLHLEVGVEPAVLWGGDLTPENNFDFAPAAGIGYDLLGKIPLGFRYLHGLNTVERIITTDAFGQTNDEFTAKTRSFQLTVGYYL